VAATRDASIRRQIKGCALFVPIISANTQVRVEGYFRRECMRRTDRSDQMTATKLGPLLARTETTVINPIPASGISRQRTWGVVLQIEPLRQDCTRSMNRRGHLQIAALACKVASVGLLA
jgi:hypothetical protein